MEKNDLLKKQGNKYQSSVFLAVLLLIVGTSISIHQFKVPPIMEQVSVSVGISAHNAPMLMSVFLLVCLVFAIPAGTLVQRMRIKSVMLLSIFLVIIGSVIGGFSNAAAPLLISRAIEGLGFLLISVAIPVAAATYANPAKIGMVMGIAGVWISTGQIAAFNTAPRLINLVPWKGVWWIYTLLTVIIMAVFFLTFKEKNKTIDRTALSKKDQPKFSNALKNKNLIFPSIGFLVYNFSLMTVVTFFPVYATSTNLMSLSKASSIASLPMIFCLVGSPILGRFADFISHKWLYSLSLFCGGIGSALMFTKQIPLIIAGTAILGFIGAATPSLMFSSLGKLVPSPDLIAQSNGIVVLFQNTGMFLAALLFGMIVRVFNGNYTLAASLVLIPMAIISVVFVLFTHYNANPINREAK